MSGFRKLAIVELRLYLRDPSAFFFTLIFPLMLMMLFGSIWGNDPFPGETFGYIDFSVSAFIGMVILTSGVMGLTTNLSAYRERGILRRFRATPLTPVSILMAQVVAVFTVTIGGVILLLIAGIVVFDLHFWGTLPEVIFAFVLSALSISALGFIPASLAPTSRSGAVMANIIYFPMLFLSGAALPLHMLPPFLQTFAQVLPLTHVIKLLQGLWLGGHLWDYPIQLAVLTGVLICGILISARFFRWE
jgi:ABC-2 type transport system permease protein